MAYHGISVYHRLTDRYMQVGILYFLTSHRHCSDFAVGVAEGLVPCASLMREADALASLTEQLEVRSARGGCDRT